MSSSRSLLFASLAGFSLCASIPAQVTQRLSVTTAEGEGHGPSGPSWISDDGRFVAFESAAKNLVLGDTNAASDIFVRDLVDGTTELVSLASGGAQGNRASYRPTISADGRFVSFVSIANNLVVADLNQAADVFVHDRETGLTTRVSVDSQGFESNADSSFARISPGGRFVAFTSQSSNLVSGDTNGVGDVFVHDRQTHTTARVSVASGGAQGNGASDNSAPSISADGSHAAFASSATNLVAGDTNGTPDIFVRDLVGLTTTRVSVDSAETQATGASSNPSISSDGAFLAFESQASNLVAGDTNGATDVFVRDFAGGTTERASLATGGAQGNGNTFLPSISSDGRYVAFASGATNLVAGDTNGFPDVFLRDRHSSTTERVSVDTGGAQVNGDSSDDVPSISADGRNVTFTSSASNLVPGDGNGGQDIFLRALGAGGTQTMSTGVGGAQSNAASTGPRISPDCRYVLFESDASNLTVGDANGLRDIFVRDQQTATMILVSVGPGGVQGNGDSFNPSISSDGRYIAFDSLASNLVAGDTNGTADVFVRDLLTNTTTRASVATGGIQGDGSSTNASIALNGSAVAFESASTNLVAGDTNGVMDVFVRDLVGNATTRASVDASGAQGNGNSNNASMSGNGQLVAFDSTADNLVTGDTNLTVDVFVRDRTLVSTLRVSVDSGGTQGLGASEDPSISADGRFVAFESAADNLVAGDTNLTVDVFVRDRTLVSTLRASVDSGGTQGLSISEDPSISADGRFVAFSSAADNLVTGDTNLSVDVFVNDRLVLSTVRVSVDTGGTQGASSSGDPSISGDGVCITFDSTASNLAPGDTNGFQDVFLRNGGTADSFVAFCFGDGLGAPCPCSNSGAVKHGCENSSTTGGALLIATGVARLSADTVRFTVSGEKPVALSIFLQGSTAVAPATYGDGLRCTGGTLKRLFAKSAVNGVVFAPQAGDLSVSARSAFLNATIPLGSTREYQVYYRDNGAFCNAPQGSNFNVSNGLLVAWGG